jgi:molybdenum cofactor guanylyltransferase
MSSPAPNTEAASPVAGAVLAGGGSRRMGRDKSLVAVDGQPMAVRVAGSLADAGCRPVVVVGGDATQLRSLGLSVIDDQWPGEGPIGAIITVLRYTSMPTVVVACDLPWLDPITVAALQPQSPMGPSPDVTVATTGRDEPLCACWMPSALSVLERQFSDGERAVHRVLAALQVLRVPVAAAALRNVNTPEDLPAPDRSG